MSSERTKRYLTSLAALAAASGLVQVAASDIEAGAATADQAVVSHQAHAVLSQTAAQNMQQTLWCQMTWGQNVTCYGSLPDAGAPVAGESLAAILQQS